MAIPIGNSSSATAMGATSASITTGGSSGLSGSPPQSGGRLSPPLLTPPSSATSQRDRADFYNTPSSSMLGSNNSSVANTNNAIEAVELQVDYWPIVRPSDHTQKEKGLSKGGDQGKNSIKSTFRNLQVWRLPQNAQMGEISLGLTVSFATKEKKQKQSKFCQL